MQYIINKIDTDIRRKVLEKTKDGKVHRKDEISRINEMKDHGEHLDEKSKKKNEEKHFSEVLEDVKKVTVEAVKLESVKVDAQLNSKEKKIERKGVFLDIKK